MTFINSNLKIIFINLSFYFIMRFYFDFYKLAKSKRIRS